MKNLTVIYSLSALPYFSKNPGKDLTIDKFELYTAALSSITRRNSGNRTVMHCDNPGAEYFQRIGIADLWDELTITIPDDLEGINPQMFWAAGKIFALKAAKSPVLMLDTDFIAWQLPELSDSITAAHTEELRPNIYPGIEHFKMNNYVFNKGFDYWVKPLNTAFLYLPDENFKQYYTDSVMDFMKSAEDCDDYLCYMVYAEQRLLALLANYKGLQVNTIMELHDANNQSRYTHTWGAKRVMREIPQEQERFCEKCRNRIKKDFPGWEWVIKKIEEQ